MKLDIIMRSYNTQDIDEKDEFEYITMAIQYTVLVRKDDLECITMHSTFQKG
jgi:hypothetical protein